jgi:hypothetical protein
MISDVSRQHPRMPADLISRFSLAPDVNRHWPDEILTLAHSGNASP